MFNQYIYCLMAEVLNDQNLFTELNLGDWFSSYNYVQSPFSQGAAADR